jgi:hypothetical protein
VADTAAAAEEEKIALQRRHDLTLKEVRTQHDNAFSAIHHAHDKAAREWTVQQQSQTDRIDNLATQNETLMNAREQDRIESIQRETDFREQDRIDSIQNQSEFQQQMHQMQAKMQQEFQAFKESLAPSQPIVLSPQRKGKKQKHASASDTPNTQATNKFDSEPSPSVQQIALRLEAEDSTVTFDREALQLEDVPPIDMASDHEADLPNDTSMLEEFDDCESQSSIHTTIEPRMEASQGNAPTMSLAQDLQSMLITQEDAHPPPSPHLA